MIKSVLIDRLGIDESSIALLVDSGMIKEDRNIFKPNSYTIINEELKKDFFNISKASNNLSVSSSDDEVINKLDSTIYDMPEYGTYYDSKTLKRTSAVGKRDSYIRMFRTFSLREQVSSAVDEIVNEATVGHEDGETVKVDFKKESKILKDGSSTRKMVEESFEKIMSLLDFDNKKQDLFRRWYIDGRLPIEAVYNNAKMKNGIHSCLMLDSLGLYELDLTSGKKGYVYSQQYSLTSDQMRDDELDNLDRSYREEQLILIGSGLFDEELLYEMSYIRLAMKAINDVHSIENSITKYRITRSGQKNIWNIDVGSMPVNKATKHLADVKQDITSDLIYDSETGVVDSNNQEGITEDWLFPARNGKNKTTVETMGGDVDFVSKIEDLEYNINKLYKGLKIPVGRLDGGSSLDFSGEDILREELKFVSFIKNLRIKFNELFYELLKREIISRGLATLSEWDDIKKDIIFKWNESNVIVENAKVNIIKERAITVGEIVDTGVVGQFISNDYIRRNILNMTDSEYEEQKKLIEQEKKDGEHAQPEEEE